MKIVLLVKQVPETGSVRMDEKTGTVIRRENDAIVNPLDLYAVETALRLKEMYNAETIAVSMGPPPAAAALREVVAMGVDSALLVSDRAFGGSDTWATSRILAAAIRREIPDFDLILCGERATDGDTGQVGPETAAALGLPVAAYAGTVEEIADGAIKLIRLADGGSEEIAVKLPAVVTVLKSVADPRLPTLDGKIKARKTEVKMLAQSELELPAGEIGLAGSPTRVVKIFHPKLTRQCTMLNASDEKTLPGTVRQTCAFLKEKEFI